METNIQISNKLFLPVYRPYIENYNNRYEVYWGGRGSGKTKFIIQKLIVKGLKEKRLILLMRKETNKLKDSVWKDLKETLTEWNLLDYFDLNKSELRATCKLNGTEFKCLGLDESEKIKGFSEMSDVFIDEITAFTEDDIDLIDGTLRSPKYKLPLQIYCAFNPVSKVNFVYKRFGFDTGIPPINTQILHTTYLDNKRLSGSFLLYLENLRIRNPQRWKIEALGEWVSLDKLVYNNWTVKEFDNKDITGKLLIGLDFGFTNDPTALVASILVEEEKRIYIFKEWGDVNKTNTEIANIIKSIGFSKSTIIADSAEPKSVEEIRRNGVLRIKESVKGPDSIIHGIQRIQQYELIVHPNCTEIITELENYSWQKDKKTNEYTNKPIDMFNHYLDALRYSLQCVDINKLRTMSKDKLGL